MNKKREVKNMAICPKCKNKLINNICQYCTWKGDIGPGRRLREMIKNVNQQKVKRKEK